MQLGGVDVDYRVHASGDHFMMMKQEDWTLQAMDDWYEKICR